MSIVRCWHALVCQTFAEVEAQHWKCVSEEWEREKERILGSLLGGGQELASLPSSIEVGC